MSDDKTYPTHKISFAEIKTDARGNEKLGRPVEIATAWPRKNDKKGSMIEWHISPKNLNEGAFFLLENERQNQRSNESDAFDQTDASPKRDTGLSR